MYETIFFLRFLCAPTILAFGIMTYIKNRSALVNHYFLRLTIFIFIWLFSYSFAYIVNDPLSKLNFFKIGYVGIIFISVSFFEFIVTFLRKKEIYPYFKYIEIGGLVFVFLLFSNLLVEGLYTYSWGVYPKAGVPLHLCFLFFFLSLFSVSFIFLAFSLLSALREKRHLDIVKIIYVLVGSIIASCGAIDFFANYGFEIFPVGFIFMIPFPLIFAYAIVRYRLMDVNLVITRTSVFVFVYSVVLGFPFVLAFGWQEQLRIIFGEIWWLVPLLTSTVLATVGPFVYLYIQKRAEERLFQEQRRYQMTLRQASIGMGRIKDLNRLVNLIVHIVTRAVRLEHSVVYLFNKKSQQYCLGGHRSRKSKLSPVDTIKNDGFLISTLRRNHQPIIYEEIKKRIEDSADLMLKQIEAEMKALQAAVIIPSFADENLLGILILGKKVSGQPFSDSDLSVFSILANQAALAIENAFFYEDMRETHEQLFKAEKMATIGTMADGLSHQINNRLHALGFIAGDLLDTIKMKKNKAMPPEVKEMMIDIEHGLNRIQENVTQGGEIVQGLLKYTRKGKEGFEKVDLDELIDASIEMTQFKIKTGEMDIIREYDRKLPKIKGNFTQLQEVFFNMIDNAYDAMTQRKTELKEEGYKPTIRISADSAGNGKIDILLKDNGIGVKDEDKDKLFTPFFTTKLSSKKGTGLGLYVIQKLIEENHGGKVVYRSQYMEGTSVHITLPIYR